MLEDKLDELLDSVLLETGCSLEPGEEFRQPALDVLRYYSRQVRVSWPPIVGKAQSVTVVVRQPVDIGFSEAGYGQLVTRAAMAASGRFSPWRGLAIGLSVVVLTPEPIAPGDDETLGRVLAGRYRRLRAVPFGLFRLNLGQEAASFALATSADALFPEAERLADAFSEHFRRFVPFLEV
ncbi:MAG: hypothetical protein P4L85_12165 [Paludisphaera borealis]|uniref:hypothetical protein n=1 Tax=Paludisphaera borealis TaxID=1387353 RepID=UPI00284EF3EB|nr:hypothetical protein [Paludisphaera borealis]MDR3620098.1 hypothetical protein [Paludisphaera borealis]